MAVTLSPSADAEIDATTPLAGGDVAAGTACHPVGAYIRYPHMDIRPMLRKRGRRCEVLSALRSSRPPLHANRRLVTDGGGAVVESTRYAAYGTRTNAAFTT